MDKFLVSSPTQLSQGFDIGNDTGLLDLDHQELFNDDQDNTTTRESNVDHDDITLHAGNDEFYGLDYPSQESLHDIVPISNNQGMNSNNGYFNNSHRFQHSKNISLDGSIYSSKISHRPNLSTSSMASLSQDAPSQYDSNHMNHSGSNNTLYSTDSVPQLSSSLSYQSFLDSPSSIKQNPQQKQQLQVPHQNTPRIIGRNKSSSVSSCNNYNAFTTPSRVPNTLSLSPVNLVSTANNKVGKTSHSMKTKGHNRSRSRLSIDATNNSLLLNNPSNGQKITTPAHSSSNYQGMNPFYTPSYVSPRVGNLSDFDDFGTPLLTPNSNSNNQANPQWANQRSTSYQHLSYLSPVANNLNCTSSSGTSSNKTNTTFTTPILLKRNDTLDSIKIEDQDDDAIKQLGKTKSCNNFVNSKFMSNESKKPGCMEDENNYKMLEQSLMDKPEMHELKKDDELFLNAADLSLKLASQLVSNPTNEIPDTLVSSNSTPGVLHSQNSPSRSYSVQSNNLPRTTSFSVPSTAGASTSDFDTNNPSMMSDVYSNQNSLQYKAMGIDLLLPQFNSNRLTDEKIIENNSRANRSNNTSFTKSYPASIDLASIATSPMNSNIQNISTINTASPTNTSNVLPTMATFSISSGQSTHPTPETFIPSPQDLKLPINVSDKTDVIDPKKKHSCPLCQARFQRPEHVKRHLKSHSSEKPYECDEPNCGKRFNRKDNLKAHLKKIHHRKL